MIIKSPRKKEITINIFLRNNDGTNYSLKRKDHIRYLGVMIDDSVSWKYHIAFIFSKISRNIGIFAKLHHFVSLQQLKQLYYNLIYPYLSYAITAWGSTYKSHLKILQTKQNHIVRLMFFAKTYGVQTESAQPLINLLEILNIENVFKLHALEFAHHWLIIGTRRHYQISLTHVCNMPKMFIATTQDMPQKKTSIGQG